MRRILAALACAGLATVGCSGSSDGPSEPAASIDDALPGVPTGVRLLVMTDDGAILNTAPDGGSAVVVRPGGGLEVEPRQPVWSPNGRSVAWVEVGTGGPPALSRLVTSRPDGSGRREVQVDTGMFFLQWDPTSSRVAYLGSYRDAIGMG